MQEICTYASAQRRWLSGVPTVTISMGIDTRASPVLVAPSDVNSKNILHLLGRQIFLFLAKIRPPAMVRSFGLTFIFEQALSSARHHDHYLCENGHAESKLELNYFRF